jgi:hypothetical protein
MFRSMNPRHISQKHNFKALCLRFFFVGRFARYNMLLTLLEPLFFVVEELVIFMCVYINKYIYIYILYMPMIILSM